MSPAAPVAPPWRSDPAASTFGSRDGKRAPAVGSDGAEWYSPEYDFDPSDPESVLKPDASEMPARPDGRREYGATHEVRARKGDLPQVSAGNPSRATSNGKPWR